MAAGFLKVAQRSTLNGKPQVEQALSISRRLGNKEYTAWALSMLGRGIVTSNFPGGTDEARAYLRDGLTLNRQLVGRWSAAFSIMITGLSLTALGDWDEGRALCEKHWGCIGNSATNGVSHRP